MAALVAVGDSSGDGRADLLAIDRSGVLFEYAGTGSGGLRTREETGLWWGLEGSAIL